MVRMGGEEFLIVLHGVDKNKGFDVAERIRNEVSLQRISCGGTNISYNVSIGIADSNDSDKEPELLNLADEALYRSKESGRNRTTVYEKNDAIKKA